MNSKQLMDFIIKPTLTHIGFCGRSDAVIISGTIAQESGCGEYIRQLGYDVDSKNGAFGITQMELFTHDSLWADFLDYREDLAAKVYGLKIYTLTDAENLMGNLPYAVAMARIKYLTIKEPLPNANDIKGMANYWKRFYNSPKGKGTEQEFVDNYNRYVKDD